MCLVLGLPREWTSTNGRVLEREEAGRDVVRCSPGEQRDGRAHMHYITLHYNALHCTALVGTKEVHFLHTMAKRGWKIRV
jgi:hypothetical protein